VSPLLKTGVLALLLPIVARLTEPAYRFEMFGLRVHGVTLALLLPAALIGLGLVHSLWRYLCGAATDFLPADLFRGPILSGSLRSATTAPPEPLRDPLYQARSGYLYLVQHDVRDLLLDLAEAGSELVVFIDDLDRCAATTTRDVFEAISLFLSEDFPVARFVIGLDPVVVAAHVDDAFSTHASGEIRHADDPSAGWSYLRKLVQLPIRLPAVPDQGVDRLLEGTLGPAAQPGLPEPPPDAPESPVAGVPTPDDGGDVLEEHPRLRALLRERLLAQPDRSVRESKRLLTVWQFYIRVLDVVDPLTGAAAVDRARTLVVLAEIVTRWPALQHRLHATVDGRRGLRLLAESTSDDVAWGRAVARLGLDRPELATAGRHLRDLLATQDGPAIAALAVKLL
jgi:hypothetical protein